MTLIIFLPNNILVWMSGQRRVLGLQERAGNVVVVLLRALCCFVVCFFHFHCGWFYCLVLSVQRPMGVLQKRHHEDPPLSCRCSISVWHWSCSPRPRGIHFSSQQLETVTEEALLLVVSLSSTSCLPLADPVWCSPRLFKIIMKWFKEDIYKFCWVLIQCY